MEYFPRFNTLQLSEKVKSLLYRLGETPENFTGRIIFMSMFNDISWGSRDNKVECESNARLVSLHHAARNKFERFRFFMELISRFEFEFCRCETFFEGFEFLVCSCECAMASLCPRNSISNVVASLTIDDNIYIYICM